MSELGVSYHWNFKLWRGIPNYNGKFHYWKYDGVLTNFMFLSLCPTQHAFVEDGNQKRVFLLSFFLSFLLLFIQLSCVNMFQMITRCTDFVAMILLSCICSSNISCMRFICLCVYSIPSVLFFFFWVGGERGIGELHSYDTPSGSWIHGLHPILSRGIGSCIEV